MLTLTRKAGESVRIGDDIRIIVKEIKGKQIRLGIIAPRDVYVCREELFLKIQEANQASSTNRSILDTEARDAFAAMRNVATKQVSGFKLSGKRVGSPNSKTKTFGNRSPQDIATKGASTASPIPSDSQLAQLETSNPSDK